MMLIQKCGRIARAPPRALSLYGYTSWRSFGEERAGPRSGNRSNGRSYERSGDRSGDRFGDRQGNSSFGYRRGGSSGGSGGSGGSYGGSGGFQGRSSAGRGNFRGNSRGKNNNNKWSRGPRGQNDDEADVMERTRGRRSTDDGLMGKPDYELNRELANMQWTQLIPAEAGEASEYSAQGVSQVPTQALAEHRLLSLPLVNSLVHNRKYERLTPVQAQTLLPILRGESCVVRAKTGTGKTAAFSIPAIQKVLEAKKQGAAEGKVKAVIITPTRELAQQIADEIFKITSFGGLSHIKVQSLVGGLSKGAQMRASGLLERSRDADVADIIVATPGRLRDILLEPGVSERFNELQFRVFDEADRILDIGFEGEINHIRDIIDEASEPGRETPLLLFSATADRTVRKFAQSQFGDRVRLVDTVPKNEPTANELVDQVAVACSTWAEVYEGAAREMTESYAKAQETGEHFKAIVFMPTTAMVDHLEKLLNRAFNYQSPIHKSIYAVHGQRSQASRQTRSDLFRKQRDAVLITTDVVARGMDFPQVSHVFQLGVPADVPSYVHRIGRTARIGNSGKSFLYYTNHVRAYMNALEREGIKPKTQLFEADAEFHQRFLQMFARSVQRDDEAAELVQSLMSYMTVLKSKYRVEPGEFMRDMVPFAELMGLEEVPLTSTMRQTWSPRTQNRRKGFGSSRKSRMRW